MVVTASCFAYGEELLTAGEKYSFDLINNAHLNGPPMIRTWTGSLRPGRAVGEQQQTAPASLLQKTSPVETGPGTIYSDSFQNDRGPLEAFHG
jgi:hypothetical protein